MITLDLDTQHTRTSALVRTAQAVSAADGSEAEVFLSGQVTVSDSVTELPISDEQFQTTGTYRGIAPPIDQWTHEYERHFAILAEKEALGKLIFSEKNELNRLSDQRRALKNPRTGQELLWEYEQRKLTRNLVEALTLYVHFHQPARGAQPA